jgi:hypothetical protein
MSRRQLTANETKLALSVLESLRGRQFTIADHQAVKRTRTCVELPDGRGLRCNHFGAMELYGANYSLHIWPQGRCGVTVAPACQIESCYGDGHAKSAAVEAARAVSKIGVHTILFIGKAAWLYAYGTRVGVDHGFAGIEKK